ncbi:aminotransferase class V-fold PLP-dependent enzyme [Pigmentibacter sp. JX0631]|uniref:aminotransferase class V-fold PLP-dependent enzyme n=1 Tax=Pigmentibacter sp. JX0631 TaxID=2976982 RepID=UPI0024690740|nr:aminotransferase class V-fold PLP-dependent enzyme [Pigmentibacter sp. JX0631]WGL60299.1 aminotransferase class V-fold PLP-dependent enzyme [Pigmentibacter sp. JX0631]
MNKSSLISKYFFPEANEKEFNKWATITLNASLNFLYNKNGKKIYGEISPKEISKLFSSPLVPLKGEKIPKVLQETIDNIVKNSVKVSHPNFIGHMTGATPSFSLLCDLLISTLNQNVVKIETGLSATYVEWQTLTWLHKLVYKRNKIFYQNIINNADKALGNYCSGGTLGNLTALLVARNKAFPEVHKKGVYAALLNSGFQRTVILVSQRGHYSIKKAATILGIGEDNIISIPCEAFTNKINIVELKKIIHNLLNTKTKIIALVGIAGTTETGNIDDLEELAKICRMYKIWFHVDAAWGGALLLSNKKRNLLKGISFADSVVIDGHKFMYLSMSHSAVLFKDENALDSIRHNANYIIRKGSIDLGRTTIEGSRRFDSLKLWFHFKALGKNGYNQLILKAISNTSQLAKLIEKSLAFELTSFPETNIVTYRYTGKILKNFFQKNSKIFKIFNNQLRNDNNDISDKKLLNLLIKINLFLNELNIYIQKKQRQSGKSFVSRTTLETVYPSQEIVVLRAIPFNPLTNKKILTDILKEQEFLGNEFLQKKGKGFLKRVPELKDFI